MMRSGICGSGQFRRRDLSTCLSSMGTRVLLVWWQNRRDIVNVGVVQRIELRAQRRSAWNRSRINGGAQDQILMHIE